MSQETNEEEGNQLVSSTVSYGRLREVLHYEPSNGVFTWLISPAKNIKAGDIAGNDTGWYIRINIDKQVYLAHRLAWFYIHRVWPIEIDHINGAIADNRLINLRNTTRGQNNCNRQPTNSSGIKGVRFRKSAYEANIKVSGKSIYLGRYTTPEEAAEAYKKAARAYFGEFTNV